MDVANQQPAAPETVIPVIRAAVLEPIGALFSRFGLNLNSVIRSAGLARIPSVSNGLYPYHDAIALLNYGARLTGIEQMGFLLGRTGGISSLGTFGDYIASAPTLYRAMLRATSLIKWISPQLSLAMRREGPLMVWQATHPRGRGDGAHNGYFHTIALLIEVVRRAAGSAWNPDEVRVGTETFATESIEQLLQARVRYCEDEWAIVFSRRLLILPMMQGFDLPQTSTRQDLTDTFIPHDFTESAKMLISSLLATHQASEDTFARVSGFSVRTFQRQLARNSGIQFRDLVRQVRTTEARMMLMNPRLRINDIAHALGYTEQANFTRAFVRWMGMPPSEYRRSTLLQRTQHTAAQTRDIEK